MKHWGVIILFAFLFSSCGLFKTTTRHKETSRTDSVEKIDNTTVKTDNSKITIKEKLDTVVKVPGYEQSGEWKLKSGSNPFEKNEFSLDSTISNLKLYYDSLSHSVKVLNKVKDQMIPVRVDRLTEIHKELNETSSSSKKTDVSKSHTELNKVAKPDYSWIFYLVGVIALLIVVAKVYHSRDSILQNLKKLF